MTDLFLGLVFLRQTGFSVILASLEAFDLGLLGEDMLEWLKVCNEEGYL